MAGAQPRWGVLCACCGVLTARGCSVRAWQRCSAVQPRSPYVLDTAIRGRGAGGVQGWWPVGQQLGNACSAQSLRGALGGRPRNPIPTRVAPALRGLDGRGCLAAIHGTDGGSRARSGGGEEDWQRSCRPDGVDGRRHSVLPTLAG